MTTQTAAHTDNEVPKCHYDKILRCRVLAGGQHDPVEGHELHLAAERRNLALAAERRDVDRIQARVHALEQCSGCRRCTRPHCIVCDHTHLTSSTARTCGDCVDGMRQTIRAIQRRSRLLRDEATAGSTEGRSGAKLLAAAPIPGGDAMYLMGPGGDGRGRTAEAARVRPTGPHIEHAADERDQEAAPPLLLLPWWEDVFRRALSHPVAHGRTSVARAADYLVRNLSAGAQQVDNIDDFDWHLKVTLRRLDAVVQTDSSDVEGVPCMRCKRKQVRKADPARPCQCLQKAARRATRASWLRRTSTPPPPKGKGQPKTVATMRRARRDGIRAARAADWHAEDCNQGGLQDVWFCPGCGRISTEAQYREAVKFNHLHNAEALHADDLAELLGGAVKPNTVRQWATRGLVARRGRDSRGRQLFDVAQARAQLRKQITKAAG